MSDIEMKKCTKCGNEYPATVEFFHKKGDKLHSKCKECRKKLKKEYLERNKEIKRKDINFLLDENSIEMFDKKAEEFNMNRVEFLKLIILKGESAPFIKINPECFDVFNYQIMGIARNINQIAHVCNMTQNIHITDIESIREELKKIREWQSKLEEEFEMIDTSIKCANKVLTFDDI